MKTRGNNYDKLLVEYKGIRARVARLINEADELVRLHVLKMDELNEAVTQGNQAKRELEAEGHEEN